MTDKRSLRRYNNGEYITQKIFDSVSDTIAPVTDSDIVYGNLLSASLITGQDNLISTNLGREYKMWLVASKDANADVWEVNSTVKQGILTLRCSANVNVKVWVA
jgi:hypothetical protein